MVGADTENGLLFGGRDGDREAIYARYAMGDPVEVVAADADRSVQSVYNLMREKPADYERSKQAREAFSHLRVQRASSVADRLQLKRLEDSDLAGEALSGILECLRKAKGKEEYSRVVERIEDFLDKNSALENRTLVKMADSLATRVRLNEGKATEIVGEEAPKTLEDLEARMKEIRDAGDGLATG